MSLPALSYLLASISLIHSAGAAKPAEEISAAIDVVAACYHWHEEIGDQSLERNEEIKRGIERDCFLAKKILEETARKYPNESGLHDSLLRMNDVGHMKLHDEELKRICEMKKHGIGCPRN